MTYPIASILTPAELAELSRKVQYCEVTWPQHYAKGDPIYMATINSLPDMIQHLGLADHPPAHLMVIDAARLRDWIKSAWNHGSMSGYKEAYHAIKTQTITAGEDEATTEREQFAIRCRAAWAKAKRAKRG